MAKKKRQSNNFFEQISGFADRDFYALLGSIEYARWLNVIVGYSKTGAQYGVAALEDAGYMLYRAFQNAHVLKHRAFRRGAVTVIAIGVLSGVGFAAVIASSTLATYSKDLASPSALMNRNRVGTTVLDRNGEVLYRADGADNRVPVKFGEVPKDFIDATLAAEDPDFYNHDGISIKGTARALWRDISQGEKVEGGSTLSQQLIKNTLLTPRKSFIRKYQEAVLAVVLERQYDKNEILELYVNEVFYGQGARGAERAAQTYFHKSLTELTLGEKAMLAGLPLGPSRFDPNFDPTSATERRNFVLHRMEELGYITEKQELAAKSESLQAYAQEIEINAPHFVFYVLEQLREKYGDDAVTTGGLTVHTTLDLKKQRIAEDEVRNQINKISWQHVTNGGLVALDPRNGEIMAMVGSVDFNNRQFGKVNVTLSRLQPGSSFKPFAYAAAFKEGYNGATQVDDKPLRIPDGSGEIYAPENYDDKFRGPVLLRRALANSLNIPAIKVIQHAGVDDTLKTAEDMGISFIGDRSRFGLSLALGSAEIKPLELAEGYATFANLGKRVDSIAINKVEDRFGEDITKLAEQSEQQALDPRIAYMIVNILSDNRARTEIFGSNSVLQLPRPAFVKTGTTEDYRDNLTAGSTPNLTTVVWVGNNDHSPMMNVSGITGAAPIWHNFMVRALEGTPELSFKAPSGIATLAVCAGDGGLVTSGGINEVFLVEAKPEKPCSTRKPSPKKQTAKKESENVLVNSSNGTGGGVLPGDPPVEEVPPPEPEPDGIIPRPRRLFD